jgi:hypothetical protein
MTVPDIGKRWNRRVHLGGEHLLLPILVTKKRPQYRSNGMSSRFRHRKKYEFTRA